MNLSPASFRPFVPIALAVVMLLTACATAPTTPITLAIPAKSGFTGNVHGGQQAVSGATVQLWAVGTTGDGSLSTPLLSPAVTTDANGNFSITGLYTCPSSSSLVYLTGTGGNPGLTAGTNNTALALMAALGTCGSLNSGTYVTMNEVTTIGSVFALAPYMAGPPFTTSYSAIGYGSDLAAITSAFNEVNEFVNTATGMPSGPALPSGFGVPAPLINTLADLLATCINTTGSESSGTPCASLFAYTYHGQNLDTISAARSIALYPTYSLTQLFALVPPLSPFQPQLTTAPTSWTITVEPVVATPTISPSGGTFTSRQIVTLADATPNATIHYTLDGTTPTDSSATYSTSLAVSATETINAIASASGDIDSSISSASFTINAPPASGTITTVAGSGASAFSGDGGPATSAGIYMPGAVAVDTSGNLYIADTPHFRIREVTAAGIISTFAGNGTCGYGGDGGQATSAQLCTPIGVASDSVGNLYVVENGLNTVREVTTAGIIVTVAGRYNSQGFSGDGGLATSASLYGPYGVTVDSSGNIFIADYGNHRVRKVNSAGIISTVAGNGTAGVGGDGGQATAAELTAPVSVAVDSGGNLYIGDNGRVRKVTPGGVISTIVTVQSVFSVVVDSSDNLYIADQNSNVVWKVTSAGVLSAYAGNRQEGFSGDGGQAIAADLYFPIGVALDSNANLYIADSANNRIRKVIH